jgi:hypothetical protein
MPINPATMNLIANTASNLLRALPRGQLARFGLARTAPAVAPLPMVGAVAGGVLITAFAIPQSRRWIFARATSIYHKARDALPRGARSADEKDAPSEADGEVQSTDAAPSAVN